MASRRLALLMLLAQAAFGQLALYRVDGDGERAVGAVCDLGTAYPAEARTVRFRVRNVSVEAVVVGSLGVNGTGFEVAAAPKLPVGLGPQEAFEFSVVFQAVQVASYSALLEAPGLGVILTAAVLPAVTVSAGPGGIVFGTVEAGTSVTRRVTISNLTSWAMPVPPISVAGEPFTIAVAPSGGAVLQPGESAAVEIRFQPAGAGNWTGTLTIGDRSYPLSGSAAGAPLPKPILSIELAEAASAQTGWVTVSFDAPAKAAGAGTVTVSLEPLAKDARDPAVRLSQPFTFRIGDAQLPPISFQTGTTAGTIAISVELGEVVETKTVTIPAAAVKLREAAGVRSAGAIEVRLTGFDNTRTAGPVVYTFYDTAGNALPAIAVDNTAAFVKHFADSEAGGAFVLRAVFPVTGDGSGIVEFAAQMSNAAGNTATGRIRF